MKTRYPGSQPFNTHHQSIFFGREKELDELHRFVHAEDLVVLYSKSGLGKSSLINAGLFQKVKAEGLLQPINIRFGAYSEERLITPLSSSIEGIRDGIEGSVNVLEKIKPPGENSLWYHLKTYQLSANKNGFLLIFDQFEELFSFSDQEVNAFGQQVSEMLYTNIPDRFRERLEEGLKINPAFVGEDELLRLHQPFNLRVLVAIRSDRMSEMNRLKTYLPNILTNCYELRPLSIKNAESAILSPAYLPQGAGPFASPVFDYEDAAVSSLIGFLSKGRQQEIESFQLQILCEYVEQKVVLGQGKTIVRETDIADPNLILQNYYLDKINSLPKADRMPARLLVEEGLVLEEEQRRLTLYEGQIIRTYGISRALLAALLDTHLLRSEPSLRGGYTYELSHDTLVTPVLKAKAERKEGERLEKENRRRKWFGAVILFFVLVLALVAWYEIDAVKKKAKKDKEEAVEKLKQLKRDSASIDSLYRMAEYRADSLQTERDSAKARLERANNKLNDVINNPKSTPKEIQDAEDEVNRMEEIVYQLDEELEGLEGKVKIAQVKLDQAKEELKGLEGKVKIAQANRDQAKVEFDIAKNNFQNVINYPNSTPKEIQFAESKVKEVEMAYAQAEIELKEAIEKANKAQAKIDKEEKELNELKNKFKIAKEKLGRAKHKLAEAKEKHEKVTSDPKPTPDELQALKDKLKKAQEEFDQAKKDLEELEAKYNKAQEELDHVRKALKELEANYDKAQEELDQVRKALKIALEPNDNKDILAHYLLVPDYPVYPKTFEPQDAAIFGISKNDIIDQSFLEAAFWLGEKGDTKDAIHILDSVAVMKNKSLTPQSSHREAIKAFNPDVYEKLMERYYPVRLNVAGGIFQMGCDTVIDKDCEKRSEILHTEIVGSFQMAKYETTWRQYYLFCKATEHEYIQPSWGMYGNNPAVNVSWYDALLYSNWVNKQFDLDTFYIIGKKREGAFGVEYDVTLNPDAKTGYRLPTEAEWEYAAKGGKNPSVVTIYSGSNKLDEVGWYNDNTRKRTHPVGSKKSNALGIYDMNGNVWEWCWDEYSAYGKSKSLQRVLGGSSRVVRGGSWGFDEKDCRSTNRESDFPYDRYDNIGFRLVFVP